MIHPDAKARPATALYFFRWPNIHHLRGNDKQFVGPKKPQPKGIGDHRDRGQSHVAAPASMELRAGPPPPDKTSFGASCLGSGKSQLFNGLLDISAATQRRIKDKCTGLTCQIHLGRPKNLFPLLPQHLVTDPCRIHL